MDDYHVKEPARKFNLMEANHKRVSVAGRDLVWMAQTVHSAYHNPPEGNGGHWFECNMGTCDFAKQILRNG